METGTASRREAIFILTCWMETNDFPDRMLTDSPDRGFIMDLVYGAVRQRRALEWVLSQLVSRMPTGETLAALLVGAQQILFMEEVPAYAAVNATVDAAKVASSRSGGFVNGVLRNLVRQREELLAKLAQQSPAVRLSHPDALFRRWEARYGLADAEALCRWDNAPSQTVLSWLPGAPDMREILDKSPVKEPFSVHPAAPESCLVLPHGMRVEQAPGFNEGWFVVQDPATLTAVNLLDVQPGQTVLDACAAPGGKTAQIAARMRGQGKLIAMDLHDDRIALLRSTLARTKQSWVEVVQGDAMMAAPDDAPLFDRILLDAPCSNTGVLRRRPDARWRYSSTRMKALCATQQALLVHLLARLKPGGRLVYSTCSLEPEENIKLVEGVLATQPNARLLETRDRLPFRDATDGAFAACLTR